MRSARTRMRGAVSRSRTAAAVASIIRLSARRVPRMGVSRTGDSRATNAFAEAGTSHPGGCRARRRGVQRLKVGFQHHLHQLVKAYFRFPSQNLARLAGIAAKVVDFGRTDQLG